MSYKERATNNVPITATINPYQEIPNNTNETTHTPAVPTSPITYSGVMAA
jgi:hypothetical protein